MRRTSSSLFAVGALVVAFAGCSLFTSTDGLSTGSPAPGDASADALSDRDGVVDPTRDADADGATARRTRSCEQLSATCGQRFDTSCCATTDVPGGTFLRNY